MGSSVLGCLMMSLTVAGLKSSEGFADLDVQENTLLGRSRCWLWAGSSAGTVDYIAYAQPLHAVWASHRSGAGF